MSEQGQRARNIRFALIIACALIAVIGLWIAASNMVLNQ
jgi:hypothetical protein